MIAQEVNLNKFVTLTVTSGQQIKLNFRAAAPNTPVRIVSGNTVENITVGFDWYVTRHWFNTNYSVLSNSTTMTIYGDITWLDCTGNQANLTDVDPNNNPDLIYVKCSINSLTSINFNSLANLQFIDFANNSITNFDGTPFPNLLGISAYNNQLTSLNVSNNPLIELIYCDGNQLTSLDISNKPNLYRLDFYNNPLSTEAINQIYCDLPNRTDSTEAGTCYPLDQTTDANHANTIAATCSNARNKNWTIQYYTDTGEIPSNGDFTCVVQEPDMTKYITLNVKNAQNIKLNFKAREANTVVRVVSGSKTININVGTDWFVPYHLDNSNYSVQSEGTTMTIYGDIVEFDCGNNNDNITGIDLSNNSQLKYLDCGFNQIPTLDVNNSDQLTKLYCDNNLLSTLNLSSNNLLTELNCSNNQITTLNLNNTAELVKLNCSFNRINELDFRSSTKLTTLNCNSNLLGALNTNNNVELTEILCSVNKLTNLNLSDNAKLAKFNCSNNELVALNVDNNPNLSELYCSNNKLSTLDVTNNIKLEKLECYKNLFDKESINKLYCSLPEKQANDNAKITPLEDLDTPNNPAILEGTSDNARAKNWRVEDIFGNNIQSQGNYNCNAPSPNMDRYITLTVKPNTEIYFNFKAAMDNTPIRIVTGGSTKDIIVGTDWYVENDNFQNPINHAILAIDNTITIYGDIIAFDCRDNQTNLTGIDLTNNSELIALACSNNKLANLNLRNSTKLQTLYCSDTRLSSLDVSRNTLLTDLNCSFNNIPELNISKNQQLAKLDCSNNQLSNLDVSKNIKLTELHCNVNNLPTVDISRNTSLQFIECYSNPFTTDELNSIYCSLPAKSENNKGTIIPSLYEISNSAPAVFAATSDNARAKNWMVLDLKSYSEIPSNGNYNCNAPALDKSKYITLGVKSGKEIILTFKAAIENTPVRIVSGSNTKDIYVGKNWYGENLTEYVKVLSDGNTMTIYGDINEFDCSNNLEDLTEIDISNNKQLITLYAAYNDLTEVNISNCPNLVNLTCNNNKLTSIDLSHNGKLELLGCGRNNLTSINLSNNSKLRELYCDNNKFTSLDVSTNSKLKTLYFAYNKISSIDLSNNVNLINLDCSANKLTSLELTNNVDLQKVYCFDNDFNSEAMNALYCSLPMKDRNNISKIFPLKSVNDNNHSVIIDATSNNARSKHWLVQYYYTEADVPSNGDFKCNANKLNLDKYITIYVKDGKAINLGVACKVSDVPIRIVNGKDTLDYIRDASYSSDNPEHKYRLMPKSDKIKVYGDIVYLDCSNNGKQVTEIDFSNNKDFKYIYCHDNDLSKLDLRNCKQLVELHCQNNDLESINLSNCISLQALYCNDNKLYSIDLSTSRSLELIYCHNNNLFELNLSFQDNLKKVVCYSNLFSTAAMNDIYCSLPIVDKKKQYSIFPVNNIKDVNYAEIIEATALNAVNKGWQVKYFTGLADVPSKGSFTCPYREVNTNRVVTIHLNSNDKIKFDFKANKGITPVRIKSGNKVVELQVGRNWFTENNPDFTFTPENDTIRIFGDITGFNCSDNEKQISNIDLKCNRGLIELYCDNNDLAYLDLRNNEFLETISCNGNRISSLDLSNTPRLRFISFYNNLFSTDDVNELYCSLPTLDKFVGECYPLNTEFDPNRYTVQAATSDIARDKNWSVVFYDNGNSQVKVPNSGSFTCDYKELDTNKYITLNVISGEEINLDFKASSKRTPIKIVTGVVEKTIYIGTNWFDGDADTKFTVTAESNEIKIYGDIIALSSTNNDGKLTGIDISNNTQIRELLLNGNGLKTIDVSKNTALQELWCSDNNLTKLELDSNTNLKVLVCANNKLSSIDVSKNAALEEFSCAGNRIEVLDLKNNPELRRLNCDRNAITSLDLSNNTKLETITCTFNKLISLDLRYNERVNNVACYNNLFDTEATNLLYCSLPVVKGLPGKCFILNESSYSYHIADIETATSNNAVEKNWKVMYWHSREDVKSSGNYNCGGGVNEYITNGISVFPNPAKGKVQVQLDEEVNETLILVDLTGRALLTADVKSGIANIDVSNLTAGTYLVKVGNKVAKLTVK